MDLSPYLSSVAQDLDRATALADDHTREVAVRVATAIEPALRLAMMQALADAAAVITSELSATTVVVRLEGRDPVISVHRAEHEEWSANAQPGPPAHASGPDDDDGDTARLTVRLPAALKSQAEERATTSGQSLNSWLVQTVRRAVASTSSSGTLPQRGTRRITGWA